MDRNAALVKLRDIAVVKQGQSPESKYYSENTGTPFLQGNRTFGHLYPTFNSYTTKVTKTAKKDEVLMSVRAPVGDLNIAPCNMCIGRGLSSLNSKVGNNTFIYYALKYSISNLQRQGAATTYSSVNRDIINDFDVIVPNNRNSWDLIAKILFNLDWKIENNNRLNLYLESVAKLIYQYWFVQFDFPDINGKPYKSNGGKMVWNKEFNREIPEGWALTSLKEKINFERGISYTSKDIESTKGIPMINLASIDINRNYKPNELKIFSGKYNEKKLITYGDMLIACTDLTQNAEVIGSPVIVPKEFNKYLFSMDLAKLNILTDDLIDTYLYMTLRTDFYHRYIKYFASGTNVLHLDLDGILWYPIAVPPKSLQESFSKLIKIYLYKQAEIINDNYSLETLRNFLLPLLMNGQVKVIL